MGFSKFAWTRILLPFGGVSLWLFAVVMDIQGAVALGLSFQVWQLIGGVVFFAGVMFSLYKHGVFFAHSNTGSRVISRTTVDDSKSQVVFISKATWGNDVTRESRLEEVLRKPRQGVVFLVNNDELGGRDKDPAPGDDNKYVEIEYRIKGKRSRIARYAQGQWACIPEREVE